MLPGKIQVKFYFRDSSNLELDAFVPVFQRWIREHVLSDLLVDVASYSHVRHGPGVVLIGDACDYSIDEQDGRRGLLFNRKRHAPARQLADAFFRALTACKLLEQE